VEYSFKTISLLVIQCNLLPNRSAEVQILKKQSGKMRYEYEGVRLAPERKVGAEDRLWRFLKERFQGLQERRAPITGEGRIRMGCFGQNHPYSSEEVVQDLAEARRIRQNQSLGEGDYLVERANAQEEGVGWQVSFEQTKQAEIPLSEKITDVQNLPLGEQLELYKTAIFYQFLGKGFFIFRSALFDDVKNGVDNLIIDKKSGLPVGAFDEVASASGERYQEKCQRILNQNLQGGASLKYGLSLKREGPNAYRLCKERMINLPLFYLAFPEKELREGIANFSPEPSNRERDALVYFLVSCFLQSEYLLESAQLNKTLKERLKAFQEAVKEVLSQESDDLLARVEGVMRTKGTEWKSIFYRLVKPTPKQPKPTPKQPTAHPTTGPKRR